MFGVFDAHPMTLKGLRAAGPPVLPGAQLLSMGLHVLDGLLFLQANRIAHCDVKEDNVLVDECGCCFIADLGEAFELVSAVCFATVVSCRLRADHRICGRDLPCSQATRMSCVSETLFTATKPTARRS
jgi:serine/threonine protein kinase